MTTQFDRIFHGMSPEVGKMRVASSGMAWKGADSDTVTAIASDNIKWAQWLRVARGFQLRIGLKDHKKEKFDGFAREDHDRLVKLFKDFFGITLETVETSFKGWNWGVADFHGQDLAFMVSDKTAFELPLRHVANSNIAGKTEVSLEFSNLTPAPGSKPGAPKQLGDELTEIRFFVPGTIKKLKGSDNGSQKSDNEDDDDEEEISAAQMFHDNIKEKAEIGQGGGDMILSFDEVLVLTPRGRYDMDMFPTFLRLRGKTYDYKVLYQSIAKLFLLPKDDQQVLFILGLSTPIRQGQTLYQYLVMQFTREEEITAELNMSEEEIAKYDKLKKNYEDPTYEVVSSVFRALAGKKIIGSGSFQSRDGHPGFKANLKAIQGDLFMLERYIFFVSKSPLLIELSDIHQVVFSRVGAASTAAGRTFDIKIVTKSGGPEHSFTSINKEEHEIVEAYLRDKKIRVKTESVPDADLLLAAVVDDEDDEDMQSVISDDEDEGGRGKKQKAVRVGGGDDDDESEEDEDFQASESDSGSPSESDSDTSGAQTASDASGDLMLTKGVKGKAKKPVKKKAAAAAKPADGSDAEDDKEKTEKAKPKPKPKPKAKANGEDAGEPMDVDGDDEKPKPKPKPKPKAKAPASPSGGAAEGSAAAKPKPKPKPKAKPKSAEVVDDAMDVDVEEEKPKPKPKPKAKASPAKEKGEGSGTGKKAAGSGKKEDKADAEEPPKKKMKKVEE